jgi:hypothetical protein
MTPSRNEFMPKDERLLDGYPGWLLEGLRRRRRLVAYCVYALITGFALLVAYGARFDLAVPAEYLEVIPTHLGALAACASWRPGSWAFPTAGGATREWTTS